MRASLASTILLLALLLPQGYQARATPCTDTGAPDNAICPCSHTAMTTKPAMDTPIDYSAPSYSILKVLPYAPTGKATFSPQIADDSAPRASTSPFETISSINRTIVYDHAKPGKLASVSGGWSNAGATSVYIGTSDSLTLQGRPSGGSSTTSYIPGPTVSISTETKPVALNATYIPNAPSMAGVSSAANSTLSKTVRPPSIHTGSIIGSGVTNTPPPGTQALVDFGTIDFNFSRSHELEIQNLATEPSSASDLTIEGYTITGVDLGSFNGTAIHAGGTLLVPLTVVGTGPGDLTSTLTIFTNAGSSAVGAGEAFNYLLNPMVVAGLRNTLAPEPASIALVGVGLAALAGLRRRRARS